MGRIKDKIWDKFFLDFYLDKRFSWRFKLVNWLTEDWLREELCGIIYDAKFCKRMLNDENKVSTTVKKRLDKIVESADYLLDI